MSEKSKILRMITHFSKTIQILGEAWEALDADDPEFLQTKLRGAHACSSLATDELKAMLERLVPGDASKISPEEFRQRLANRDRNALYKAFKKRSAELRASPPEKIDA